MGHASYIQESDVYEVRYITEDTSIDTDIEVVLPAITDTAIEVYRANMAESVNQGLAYAIYKNNTKVGFVYNYIRESKYYGASIYIPGSVVTCLGLKTMFEICDNHKIQFVPHANNLSGFLPMATGENIRAYHSGKPFISVTKKYMYPRVKKLYHYLNIQETV